MITSFRSIVILLAVLTFTRAAFGDAPSNQATIPSDQWESHAEGVAIALSLRTRAQNNHQKSVITVYLKNTSDSAKEYVINSSDGGFEFYTLDDKGAWHPLHDYDSNDGAGLVTPRTINPGETISRSIDLSPDDLALVKARAIKCKFFFQDPATYKRGMVESSSKTLTEEFVK